MWASASYTDTGLQREHNEDAVLDLGKERLWAVADGMGGHDCGDYASSHIVERLSGYRQHPPDGDAMRSIDTLLEQANQHLIEKSRAERLDVIGSTVAVLSFHDDRVLCSWCGDSRIYRVRKGQLMQLTRDHNIRSMLDDSDVFAGHRLDTALPDMLTAAIGGDAETAIEHCHYHLQSSDRFLLCTDGLYKEISEEEISEQLLSDVEPAGILDAFATTYRERGARDNIGLVCVVNNELLEDA